VLALVPADHSFAFVFFLLNIKTSSLQIFLSVAHEVGLYPATAIKSQRIQFSACQFF
jgi:hypothetical protein